MSFSKRTATLPVLLLTATMGIAAEDAEYLADANGCKFLIPEGAPANLKLKWDGTCVDGYLSGPGTANLGAVEFKGEFKQGVLANGEVNLTNGPRYVGELQANRPRGLGELRLPNGFTIKGRFEDPSHVTGIVDLSWADGSVYNGEAINMGTMHGKGKLRFADGRAYEGSFQQNKFHGAGKLVQPGGNSYEGEFAFGNYHGPGTLVYSNDARYTGEFANGLQQGKGRLTHANGTIEEGEWKGDRLYGECHMKYADGSEYIGHCLVGQLSGQGKFRDAANESLYEGEFLAGKYHGRGRISGPGYVYEGEFVGGVRSGKGKEVLETGDQYEGTFARGVREGHGTLRSVAADGLEASYEGEFKNGLLHGAGKLKAGTSRYEGEFKQGTFNKGRVYTEDGRVLEMDVEQDTVLEIRPDGAKVPFTLDRTAEPKA
jgi:hypothetical protein